MNDRPWRHFISLFTTTEVTDNASDLVAALEQAFKDNGLPGPYSTETNPVDKKGLPIAKVETKDSESGIWIGKHLIFMPIGYDATPEQFFKVLRTTPLGAFSALTYAMSSSKITRVEKEVAEKSQDTEVKSLLADSSAQEFSKNFTKKIADGLVAKDVITISKSEIDGLLVDMSIRIEAPEAVSGQTVTDLLTRIEANLVKLKAHENDVQEQARRIFE